jgi:Ti-type conjugative transfer relaxase TraA
MAIYHLSMKTVSRASGRSAVGAAAYRSGTRLTNERDGLTHDYTRKGGIEHSEIVLPEGSNAEWARDRETLWNAAEFAEKRKDARVAREIEVALPHELTGDERLELVREFSQSLADRYGVAVDFAIHTPDNDMDIRNHHAHIMMTTRQVGEDGLGDKTDLERENKWLKANDLPTTDEQLKALRVEWEETANLALARAGHDIRIDHRSHQDRGLEIEPTQHVGVHATQMDRRGKEVERERLAEEARARNAELIRENPDQVLTLISDEKSVFDRRDVARTLHRYINDDPAEYQALYTKVMASDELVRIADGPEGVRYSTREMVELETRMARDVSAMSGRGRHGVDGQHIDRAIDRQDEAIRRSVAAGLPDELGADERARRMAGVGISDEQRQAVRHLTGDEQVSVVVGFAGAGKSTMLAAAREAWEAEGYTVHGAALAGKAVAGLEETAGIEGRTLASWEMRWKMGTAQLGPRDVLVIDEAGMVGSRQLGRFVSEAERTGAKIVLVGDHEQLQAIGAGAPFRAIAEEVGYVSVEDVRRQRQDWQREASRDFATQQTERGLSAYHERGAVHLVADQDTARAALVRDYVDDALDRPEGTRAAMAHRRADVRELNEDIREALKDRGQLQGQDITYKTENGERSFTAGDRIVFLQNNRDLDVKNGTLGTVERVEDGRLLARIDGQGMEGRGRAVQIDAGEYKSFDHGYATTIHKTQGATVDRAYVLASDTMDRHMTYVAMTRHRDQAQLYAGEDQFADMDALKSRLGRSGAKETVLDYVDRDGRRLDTGQAVGDFARRRGVESDIVYPADKQRMDRERGDLPLQGDPAPSVRKRSMFAGLKLKADEIDGDARGRDAAAESTTSRGDRAARPDRVERETSRQNEQTSIDKAVDRYARAYSAAAEMQRDGLPILEGQKKALRDAQRSLDQAQPGAAGVMESALRHSPAMRQAMMELSGNERTRTLMTGMAQEREALADPHVRADRVVDRWKSLSSQRDRLQGWQHDDQRAPVEKQMRQVAEGIGRDPQVESLLRQRRQELGLGKGATGESISRELERSIQYGRDRDRGLGL